MLHVYGQDKSELMSVYSVCIVWYMIEAFYSYDLEIRLDFGQIVFGSLLWVETRELYVVSRLRAASKASKAPQVYISTIPTHSGVFPVFSHESPDSTRGEWIEDY